MLKGFSKNWYRRIGSIRIGKRGSITNIILLFVILYGNSSFFECPFRTLTLAMRVGVCGAASTLPTDAELVHLTPACRSVRNASETETTKTTTSTCSGINLYQPRRR